MPSENKAYDLKVVLKIFVVVVCMVFDSPLSFLAVKCLLHFNHKLQKTHLCYFYIHTCTE